MSKATPGFIAIVLMLLFTSIAQSQTDPPVQTPVVTAETDLAMLDEDGLRLLVRNLIKRVEGLERKLAIKPADEQELTELQRKTDRLLNRIEVLNAENNELKLQLEALTRENHALSNLHEPLEAEPAAANDVAKYRYEYEYYLISDSGKGRMVMRKRDGSREVVRYRFSEYMNDRIGVDIFFRNDSTTPASYSMGIAAASKIYGFSDRKRDVLAVTTHRTPVIQPGEVHKFTVTLMVDNPRNVDIIEIGNVQSVSEKTE